MGLRLQADADVLDGAGEDAVGDAGEGARAEVLRVAELGGPGAGDVGVFQVAAGGVEGAELDGDAGAYAQQGGEGAFVEGGGALVAQDAGGGVEGGGVGGACLQADFYYVEGLTLGF